MEAFLGVVKHQERDPTQPLKFVQLFFSVHLCVFGLKKFSTDDILC